ncbi:MAG: cation transporter [Alphaproteobacteria bacterium]|nr:cation transporter [Alphaproteobacteria bacterium]
MTFDQTAIVVILVALFAAFASDRIRLEAAAFAGLAVAFILGLVPAAQVFSGFSHPAVITVVEILVLVRAMQNAHILDAVALRLTRTFRTRWSVVAVLSISGAFFSIFMNNVGALALMFPIAISLCARARIDLAQVLMPLSFATLLGGLCSIIGTPANLVVNDALRAASGHGFAFFDLGRVGAPVAIAGLVLVILWPVSFFLSGRKPRQGHENDSDNPLLSEVRITDGSVWSGTRLPLIDADIGGRVHGVFRNGVAVFGRRSEIRVQPGDVLLIEGPASVIRERMVQRDIAQSGAPDPPASVEAEAVVVPNSIVLGSRLGTLNGLTSRGVAIRGVVTRTKRIEGRLADFQLSVGDVLQVSGRSEHLAAAIADAGLLSLAASETHGPVSAGFPALLVFAGAVMLTAFSITPPEIAFGLSIAVLAALGRFDLRAAVRGLNWPIILMLAAMIPLGEAVETTGAAHIIATAAISSLPSTSPLMICAGILLTSVIVTPFVNNASAAIILSPIAIEIARSTNTPVEAVLVAVAIGVSLDFLTPFGHHNNTIVMGAGGYRFLDFPRLGLPLVCVTAAVAIIMISMVWL